MVLLCEREVAEGRAERQASERRKALRFIRLGFYPSFDSDGVLLAAGIDQALCVGGCYAGSTSDMQAATRFPFHVVERFDLQIDGIEVRSCLLYTSPSPRDRTRSRMPSSA